MRFYAMLVAWGAWLTTRARPRAEDDRGDVPGWVMVTVMSAVLVVAILGIFEPQIKDALSGILDKISNNK